MARLNVNPTRMELTRLKKRLKTATRGHKLLKDKRDELMKQFLDIVRTSQKLRLQVEADLTEAYRGFSAASALMSPEMMEQTFLYPKQNVAIDMSFKNVMSVNVPIYSVQTKTQDISDIFPYSFVSTPAELDNSVMRLSQLLNDMLKLAEYEKTVKLLAQEIEKTRRRVNALEYVMIPQLNETIRYIIMKLDENERGNTTRLMKVKDMMLKEAREKANERDKAV
ncbi:MAG: V-type ATP synthase subunit D [Candidatus Fimivivens sp.]|nr:V-type ATP synthase subunit D [Candidatus Fimivivens sp.]